MAAEVRSGEPVTPLVASVSPFLKPVNVAVNVGLASPYSRESLSAVTLSVAFETARLPSTNVKS